MNVLGESEFAVRLPAVVMGILGISGYSSGLANDTWETGVVS